MILSKDGKVLVLLFIGAVLVLTLGLNSHGVEFRKDEVLYFKSTQEMVKSGDFLSPKFLGENRFQKPILFYWLILVAYKFFGVSWFAVRLVAVVFGALCVLLTWVLAKELFDRKIANLSAVMLLSMPLFFWHAKCAVPDMPMNFFVILAIYSAFKFIQDPTGKKYFWLFFISCAIGFMLKGFTAVILPFGVLMAYALWIHRAETLRKINFPRGLLVMAVIILPWFLYMAQVHGPEYTNHLWIAETKERILSPAPINIFVKVGSSLLRNTVVYFRALVIFFLPWSLLLIAAIPFAIGQIKQNEQNKKSWGLMFMWFLMVWGFFLPLYVTIDHYLLILSTPLAIVVSAFLFRQAKSFYTPALILALVMVGVHSLQTPLMAKAGLCTDIPLERLAKKVHQDCRGRCAIAIASPDLVENEWQLYFDQRIENLGTRSPLLTSVLIRQFGQQAAPQLYCLVLFKDYQTYRAQFDDLRFKILQQDEIRRPGVLTYLKERIVLLRRDINVPNPSK